jgi:predicted MFS family arabinose efflux permease
VYKPRYYRRISFAHKLCAYKNQWNLDMAIIHQTHSQPMATDPLPAARVRLMAAGAGLAVAAIYYSQPMLGILAAGLGASTAAIGYVPMLTQLGYALGILLLAPLGDRHDRRTLILVKSVGLALALLASGLSSSLAPLLVASLGIGLTATLAQDIVPAAAALAPELRRGKVVGSVMTGLLTGILLSRVVSGFAAEYFGWRSVFIAAAASIAIAGLALRAGLPRLPASTTMSYRALLASLWSLLRKHCTLRRAALAQGLLSMGFSAFWSCLALMLSQPPYHLGSTVAGAFGLAGAAGALIAPLAGHMADRRGAASVSRLGAGLTALSFGMLTLGATLPPATGLWLLIIGTVGFDMGVQVSLISHQTLIYGIDPAARSRLNAILFVGMFVGMSTGAAIGSALLAHAGWRALTGFATLAALAALAVRCLPTPAADKA